MTEPVHTVKLSVPEPAETADKQDSLSALQWPAQNREAIRSSNCYVEVYGLPLGKIRLY